MAIVRMKHLRLIALAKDRDALLHDLSRLGVLEITEPQADEWSQQWTPSVADTARLRSELSEVTSAMSVISQHVKIKRGLFAQKKPISEKIFFSDEIISEALDDARLVNEYARDYTASFAEEGRLLSKKENLMPWRELDISLDTASGKVHFATLGTVPSIFDLGQVKSDVQEAVPDALIECASTDREQHYLFILSHKNDEEALLESLRVYRFSKTQFKEIVGTAKENITQIDSAIKTLQENREQLREKIVKMAENISRMETACDALTTRAARASAQENIMETTRTIMLDGWFPEREVQRLTKLFDAYGAAYEIRDPNDDEEPPILTYNSKMIAPFELVTNMYSPPAYRGIDPNPFMAPFFAVFFGIMFSDAAYGLLLMIVGAIVLLKFKPSGFMKQMMSLAFICGITTFMWGALFGGFFGDAIPTIYNMVTGKQFGYDLALWFNPVDDPMKMLIFSFALGGIHIFAGMAIQAYLLIRDGHLIDAIFDIGSWWVLLGGAVFAILGIMPLGLILMAVGALALLLTQGRHEKKFFKKITKGLSSLYDITSYLGDILSYSRLLALSLATAVIASVINTMGALTGPIGFVIVFLIGHTFNLAVNLIGTFVHTSRLQYVEFFGKFYQGGGVQFAPLDTKTKYVDIIKEEN